MILVCCDTNLYMSIDQPIQFNIIIIFAKWIDQHFGNFEPSNVKTKLKQKWIKNIIT